jgi:hypothetical protein
LSDLLLEIAKCRRGRRAPIMLLFGRLFRHLLHSLHSPRNRATEEM